MVIKKPKGINQSIIKQRLKFEECNYVYRRIRLFKDHSKVTDKVNKIVLNSNVDLRLQTLDGIAPHTYSASTGKVCKTELLKLLILQEKYNITLSKLTKHCRSSA